MDESIPGFEDLDSPTPGFEDIDTYDVKAKPDDYKSILHEAAQSVIQSNQQAQAGASEWLRNPMGGSESYMKGFSNPSASESFAQQFTRQNMEMNPGDLQESNTIPAFINSLPYSLTGSTIDTALNPLQAVIGAGIGKYGGAVAKGIGKIPTPFGKNVGDIASAIGNANLNPIKAVGKGIGKSARYLSDVFRSPSTIKDLEGQISSHEGFIKDSLSSLSEEAKNAVLSGKKSIQEVAKGNSMVYEDILESIDKGLEKPITSEEYLENVVKPALAESSAQGLPKGASSIKLNELVQRYAPKEEPGNVMTDMLGMPKKQIPIKPTKLSLNDIKNIKNEVYESMRVASQSGTQQHVARDVTADIFSKYHKKFLEIRVPEFSGLQSEYGPQIEAQRFGYEQFQPSESSVDKGVNVLTRAAKSKADLVKGRFDEENLLSQLERGTKRFQGTGSLRGHTEGIANSIAGYKKSIGNFQPRLDYAKQLRNVRDDIIKWGITAALGGTSYALARGAGNVLAHSTD